jgi:hypothetical protein
MRITTLQKLPQMLFGIAAHPTYHRWNVFRNRCNVCRRNTVFLCDCPSDRWIRKCIFCRSTPKYRAIVAVLEEHLGQSLSSYLKNPSHALYELTSTSPIYRCHHHRLNYVCSVYFSDKPFKAEMKTRVWNEDIQDTHFPADSFDVIISSETMEHIRKPWDGFREMYRILKTGGIHCFTIPYYENRLTVSRIDTSRSTDVDLLPHIYHQDPYRRADSLVYTDFGSDIFDSLTALGFRTTEHLVWNERADIRDDFRPMRVFLSEKVLSESGECVARQRTA